jgi:glycosyltransferase involved in cell wall biosynthesis
VSEAVSTPDRRPLVTIGIPSYDCARYIEQTVRSALAQTYGHIEVLVVDDVSSDDTLSLLAAVDDPRLRVLCNPVNLGAVGNWNRVLDEARGEFVKLLHSDDLIEREAIEMQLAPMLADERVVLVSSRRRIIGQDGKRITTRGARWGQGAIDGREVVRRMVREGSNLIGEPSAVLMRAATLRVAGGFDAGAAYAVDMDLWARLLAHGALYFVPTLLSSFRVSAGQWSVRLADSQAQDVARLLERLGADPSLGLSGADVRAGIRSAMRQAWARRILYAVLSLKRGGRW